MSEDTNEWGWGFPVLDICIIALAALCFAVAVT